MDPNHNPEKDCLLRHSRFHLSFENSQDEFYVTEKVWGALKMGTIPIIWGDTSSRIRSVLPSSNAAIFADDFPSDLELAAFVHKVALYGTFALCERVFSSMFARCSQVDQNETLYNSFLKWKTEPFQPGFEEQVATGMERMFCRVCEAVVS